MLSIIRNIYFPISVLLTTIISFPFFLIRPFSIKNNLVFQKIFNIVSVPFMGFDYKIEGLNNFSENTPCILIGNHQHNFDMLMFSKGFTENILIIGKKEIALLPFFGQLFWLSGNILLNRKNNKSAIGALGQVEKKILEDKVSVLIFPEGHRNSGYELLPFKKGAFYSAVNAQVPIVCFSVSSYARNMNLNHINAASMHIKYHPPIFTKGMSKENIPALMEMARNLIISGRDELDQKLGYQ